MRIGTFLKYILIFFLIVFVYDKVIFYINTDYFKIVKIKNEGEKNSLNEEFFKKLKNIEGKNIWYIDTKMMEEQLKKDVRVKDLKIDREFPDTIRYKVTERRPYLYIIYNKRVFIADDEGVIFAFKSEYDSMDLIVMELKTENDITEMLKVVKNIDENFKGISSLIYKDEECIKIILKDGIVIKTTEDVVLKKYENGYKLYKQLVFNQQGQQISYIDLRFKETDYIVK